MRGHLALQYALLMPDAVCNKAGKYTPSMRSTVAGAAVADTGRPDSSACYGSVHTKGRLLIVCGDGSQDVLAPKVEDGED